MVNQNIDEIVRARLDDFDDVVTQMENIFPKPTITPTTSYNEALYKAGQHSVLEILRATIDRIKEEKKTLIGDI